MTHFSLFHISGLDMTQFRPDNADGYKTGQPGPVYDLYAVVNHYGGMYSGHYTAYARSTHEGVDYGWRVFDDARVSKMSPQDLVTRSAYILFYRLRE